MSWKYLLKFLLYRLKKDFSRAENLIMPFFEERVSAPRQPPGNEPEASRESPHPFPAQTVIIDPKGPHEEGQGWIREERKEVVGKRSPYLPPVIDLTPSQEIGRLMKRLITGFSRRKKRYCQEALLLDFKSSLRSSLSYGGKIFRLCWKGRKPKPRQVLLILDTSGSMMPSAALMLLFLYALKEEFIDLEVFGFGTQLDYLTPYLDLPFEDLLEKLRHMPQWNFGRTELCPPLEQLRTQYAHLLTPRTVAILFTDCLFFEGASAFPPLRELGKKIKRLYIFNPHPAAKDLKWPYYHQTLNDFARAVNRLVLVPTPEDMVMGLRQALR